MFSKFSFFKSNRTNHTPDVLPGDNLKLCPECGDEYRSEFNECAICQVDLISANRQKNGHSRNDQKKNERSMQITPDNELVTMRRGNLLEMKNIQRLLKNEMIGSLLVEDRSDGGKGCCNSKIFELRVKKEDGVDVNQILVEDFKRTTALDSHDFQDEAVAVFDQRSTQVKCPACGCQFLPDDRTCPECGLCF